MSAVDSPIYNSWQGAKQRCRNPKNKSYAGYGGRGIEFCDRWLVFSNFEADMLPTWFKGAELDRINNNGNYEPSNCRWATISQNQKNRRNSSSIQSQYENVSWHKETESWRVNIDRRGFDSEEEANRIATLLRDYLKSIT